MEPVGKLICGGLATIALGLVSHMAGTSEAVIDKLHSQSNAALAATGIRGVTVAFEQDPMRRVALLSGTVDPYVKSSALASVRALPGMMGARWVDPKPTVVAAATLPGKGDGEVEPKPATAPTPHAVSKAYARNVGSGTATTPQNPTASVCQGKVDAAIGGRKITFRPGSPWVNLEARALIADVAGALSKCPGAHVIIGGHADERGSAQVNQNMSQARAEAVRDFLIARGFPAARVVARGYGSAPAAGGGTTNRRISFTVNGG